MIDLNLKPKEIEEEPLGLVILGCMPFVAAFVWFIFSAL